VSLEAGYLSGVPEFGPEYDIPIVQNKVHTVDNFATTRKVPLEYSPRFIVVLLLLKSFLPILCCPWLE